MISTGHLIYGNPDDPIISRLRQLAQKEFTEGPAGISDFAKDFYRYMILDQYEDTLDVVDDALNSRLNGTEILKKALAYHYKDQGRWFPKLKNILKDLREWNPALENKIREYLSKNEINLLKEIIDEIFALEGGIQRFEFETIPDYTVPIADVEIVLIRHGLPSKDENLPPHQWVLDYTAYLELAKYLDTSEMQEVEAIYTSPQIKAKQTASFFFSQLKLCNELKKVEELIEAKRPKTYYEDYHEVIKDYFTGQRMDEGWEEWGESERRAVNVVQQIAKEARNKRKRRIAVVGHGLFFMALKKQICNLSKEELFEHWQKIPFAPYSVIQVNAFGDIEWVSEIEIKKE